MGTDRATLLARRVPHDEVIVGRAYIIHARNGGVGVAVCRTLAVAIGVLNWSGPAPDSGRAQPLAL